MHSTQEASSDRECQMER